MSYVTQYNVALGVTVLEVQSSKPAGYTVESLMQKLLKNYIRRFMLLKHFIYEASHYKYVKPNFYSYWITG